MQYRKTGFTVIFLAILFWACFPARVLKYNLADINDLEKFDAVKISNHLKDTFRFHQPVKGQSVNFPEEFNFRNEKEFTNYLRKSKTVAFLIIQNDTLLYEKYFKGYSKDRAIPSFSVSKSFVSALLGIAIEEQLIESTDSPISRYDSIFRGMGHISIQDVLDMQAGFKFGENYFNPFSEVAKYYYGRDINRFLSGLKAKEKKYGEFHYQSVNTQVLAKVIENATQKSIAEYLEEKIWKPLQMEYDAGWSIDDRGTIKAFCCINARSRDFAKLGRLYLRGGNWDGTQIIPEEWVYRSLYFEEEKNEFKYSMHWWHNVDVKKVRSEITPDSLKKPYLIERKNNGAIKQIKQPHGDTFARGVLGQYIYIHPEKNLIIVRMGKGFGFTPWNKLFKAIAAAN